MEGIPTITDADREAAEALRVILADISGFWHRQGDDGPLCIALARHREHAERAASLGAKPFRARVVPLKGPQHNRETDNDARDAAMPPPIQRSGRAR